MAINLKQEIDRTIELKNKVVTAKNNINKVIVRGGANNPKRQKKQQEIQKVWLDNIKRWQQVLYINE